MSNEIDFSTTYLGMNLRGPLVVSANPLTGHMAMLRRMEESGAAAIVLPSLFAEQIEREELEASRFLDGMVDAHSESSSYFPDMDFYNAGRDAYVHHLQQAKQELTIPIIASLNGSRLGQWVREAKRLTDAGADALELNIYDVPVDPELSSTQVEDRQLELVEAVRREVAIPIAVKIGPYYTSLPHFARRLKSVGANGLVLFNRYLEPELDLHEMSVVPHLELSRPAEMRLPLRWIAILRDQLSLSLAATSGVHSSTEALKLLLAGADVVMMASCLLRNGVDQLEAVFMGVQEWMRQREYTSVSQLRGSMSRQNCPDPAGFERANYIKAIVSYV